MKFRAVLFLLALCCCVFADVVATKAAKPPVLDGNLNDECWKNAVLFNAFQINNKGTKATPGQCLFTFDTEYVYVAFKTDFPAGKKEVSVTHSSGGIFMDDSFEIMLDPNCTRDFYYHIVVNAKGAVATYTRGQAGIVNQGAWRNDVVQAKCKADETGWTAEVRVPLWALDISDANVRWGFNCARNIVKPDEASSIAEGGAFHNAGRFAVIEGIDVNAAKKFCWKIGECDVDLRSKDDKILATVKVPVSNLADDKRGAIVGIYWMNKDAVVGQHKKYVFSKKETVNTAFSNLVLPGKGDYKILVDVIEPESKKPLCGRSFKYKADVKSLEIIVNRPSYRNAIFASQKLKEVEYIVKCQEKGEIETGILDEAGKQLFVKKLQKGDVVRCPVEGLPFGKMKIYAKYGEQIVDAPLRKLEYKAGEVFFDEQGFICRDGKRFWPMMEWGDKTTPLCNAAYYVIPGKLYVDPMHAWSYPERKELRKRILNADDKRFLEEKMRKAKENPNLFAWFLCDEPDCQGISPDWLRDFCGILHDIDPYHPCVISTYSNGLEFNGTADINGLHAYPTVKKYGKRGSFGKVVSYFDNIRRVGNSKGRAPAITYIVPGYNNGDCGSFNNRIYTFDETRTESLIAITMGSRGTEFYVWTGIHYPELYIGNKEWCLELKALEPVLLSDDAWDSKTMSVSSKDVRCQVKYVGNEVWIFACGAIEGTVDATFSIPKLGNRTLHVFREGRTIQANGGKFQDKLTNYDARIYTTDARDFGLKTLKQVEEEIEAVHKRQKKAGNLAYQRYEGDSLEIKASSNRFATRRNPENCLWHVTDGVIEGEVAPRAHGKGGTLVWFASSKAKAPHWLEFSFKEKQKIGRAVIYPVNDCVAEYEVQVQEGTEWRTIAKCKCEGGASSYSCKFKPLDISKFRICLTAVKGSEIGLREVECYGE